MKTITTISRTLLVMMIAIIIPISTLGQDNKTPRENEDKEQYIPVVEVNPFKCSSYAEEALVIGNRYYNVGDYWNALKYYNFAEVNYHNTGQENQEAELLILIGDCITLLNNNNPNDEHTLDNSIDESTIPPYIKEPARVLEFGTLLYYSAEYYYTEAAKLFHRIGNYHLLKKDYEQTKQSFDKSKNIFETIHTQWNLEDYASLLESYALYFYYQHQYPEAYSYIQQALDISYKKVHENLKSFSSSERTSYWEIKSRLYFSSLPNIAFAIDDDTVPSLLYDKSALFAKGLLLNSENEIIRIIYGDQEATSIYNDLQNTRNNIKTFNECPEELKTLKKQAERINKELMELELVGASDTTKIKQHIRKNVEDNIDAKIMGKPIIIYHYSNLQTSEEASRRKFNLYVELINLTESIKPLDAERERELKSLKNRAEFEEKELMSYLNKLENFNNFTENLQLTWRDIQSKLGPNDFAIEFLSFPKLGDENTTMYIALTVRPGYDYPHMIELCEEKDLIAAKENAYTGPELSKLIWKELADAGELKGVDNIYFSPSGLLHTIAIESVPHWSKKGVMMSDTFNIYRLSSTRELALNRKMVDGANGASVYGGISYNAPVEAMGAPRFGGRETYFAAADLPSPEVMPTQNNQNRAYHVVELEDGTRALQWDSLPGSSEEAIAVTSLLESKMDTHLMTDLVSTEASFKELSGQKRKLIHIATHGFYWSDSTALRHKQMVLMPSNYEKMQEQDKSMVRSGLLFSGAQNTFFHKAIPEGVDDGILTAQEVSNIDLRGLDLVVLSACQTALGEISGEGVFGLQRGFKMAGAQSIIMSLWSVSDKATQDMMTEFYKAYNPDINNKREAFLIAQKFVKEHDSDYTYSNDEDEDQELRKTHPHWAAFILLDAIDK